MRRSTVLGLLAVLCCTAWTLWTTTKVAYDSSPHNTLRYEWSTSYIGYDASMILSGVEHKNLAETFVFWSGSWAHVVNKFYRPIPSVLWWAMYHTVGENLAAFLGVLALSHVIATLVLWRFLCFLLRSETSGTIATCAFALGLAHHLFSLATPAYALGAWIDLVEPWLMIPYVLTCWAFVKYLREGGRWLLVALTLFIVSVCVKEAAYSLPFMAAAILWYEKRLEKWRALLPFGAMAVLALCYRNWALQGAGTKFGSNGSWLQRAWVEIGGGLPAALLNRHEYLPLMVAAAVLMLACILASRHRAAVGFGLMAGASGYGAALMSRGLEDPFYYQLLGGSRAMLPQVVCVTLWLALVYQVGALRDRRQLFGLWWVLATYSVLIFAPTTLHTLYLTAAGFGIVVGVAGENAGRALMQKLRQQNVSATVPLPAAP